MQQFSASAAVPSTVDVFNNQSRSFSQAITGGPFNINNIPLATGPGTMRVVLRDANGKETVSEYAYYTSTSILAPGLLDYSLETGFARRFFGQLSDDYGGDPIASGSARYGVTPQMTVEGHAEGGAGLVNFGVASDFSLWHYGVVSLAVSGSDWNGAVGGLGFGSFETTLWGARLMARTQRSFSDYQDLASVTAPRCPAGDHMRIGSLRLQKARSDLPVDTAQLRRRFPQSRLHGHPDLAATPTKSDAFLQPRVPVGQ